MELLVLYLGIVCVGYFVGAKFMRNDKEYSWINKITLLCLMVLIFTMGARIGSNKQVISSLSTIGVKALVITVLCFAGSMAGVFLTRKLFKIDRKGVRRVD